jgi:hypothetical protein
MKIKDRAKPKTPPVEPGVYMAICIGCVDLGEQYNETFKNRSNKCLYIFELIGETIEVDGEMKPRQLSKEFAISSSSKSNLRKFIESWNGKSYTDDDFMELDLFDQIGKSCQINVVLNDTKEYANIDNLMPLPRGMAPFTTETPAVRWDMSAWDDEVFKTLPEWIQDKIKKSTEYATDHAPETAIEVKDNVAGEDVCPI